MKQTYELKNEAISLDTAELRPIFHEAEGRRMVENKEFRIVYNKDLEKVSAVVGKDYKVVQHREVAEAVLEAVENLNIKTKGVIRDANDFFMMDLEFEDAKMEVKVGEEFMAGIRVINSYNKTAGLIILPRLKRLACSNGMVVDVAGMRGINMAHNNKLVTQFAEKIPQLIAQMIHDNVKFKALVNGCIADSIEWDAMKRIMKKLFETEKHRQAIEIILLQTDKPSYTRWDLYNAITNYCTHGGQLSPAMEQYYQSKAKRVLTTPLAQLPQIEVVVQ